MKAAVRHERSTMKHTLNAITASRWITVTGCMLSVSCTGILGPGESEGDDGPTPTLTGTGDPSSLPVHHMTPAEYNNTVAHLTGTSLKPADYFESSDPTGFDTNAASLNTLSEKLVHDYFTAAKDLAEDVFKNDAQRARILTCEASSDTDTACARTIIQDFGLRAWRRPLETEELDRYTKVYGELRAALQLNHADAMKMVVRTLLTSPNFLFRIELDSDVNSKSPRTLNGYEMASRLSYLLWSSLPDDELFTAAKNDELATTDALVSQVDRMLADDKSHAFYDNFYGQWLTTKRLLSHDTAVTAYPLWNETVKIAMYDQINTYLAEFTTGDRPWTEFLSAPHPASAALDPIYASDPAGARAGFLLLPGFLTMTSRAEKTTPTPRAAAVIQGVFCTDIEPPPGIPAAPEKGDEGAPATRREIILAHSSKPGCSACHQSLDPIGLSLENFDGIGAYRAAYEDGEVVDATGEYQGQAFKDISGLMPMLAQDERVVSCPPTELFTYAMRRLPTKADRAYIKQLTTDWHGGTIRDLAKHVVASDAFRYRIPNGEAK